MTAGNFRAELASLFGAAANVGRSKMVVRAGDLHRAATRVLVRVERLISGNPGDVRLVRECRLGTADRLRTGLPGVFQASGPDACRAARGRRQTHPGRRHRDGPALCAQPLGGHHDQDRHIALRRCRAPGHARGHGGVPGGVDRGGGRRRCVRGQGARDIARARDMAQVASDAGLSRENLYKALSGEHVPTFDTVLRVVGALGLKLRAEASAAVQRQSG